jgi:hypothetical protein
MKTFVSLLHESVKSITKDAVVVNKAGCMMQ